MDWVMLTSSLQGSIDSSMRRRRMCGTDMVSATGQFTHGVNSFTARWPVVVVDVVVPWVNFRSVARYLARIGGKPALM